MCDHIYLTTHTYVVYLRNVACMHVVHVKKIFICTCARIQHGVNQVDDFTHRNNIATRISTCPLLPTFSIIRCNITFSVTELAANRLVASVLTTDDPQKVIEKIEKILFWDLPNRQPQNTYVCMYDVN